MTNRTLFFLLLILVTALPIATTTTYATDTPSPEQLVAEFQKLPHYEMYCRDDSLGGAEPIKVGVKFKTYFSKEFYQLFLWVACGQPKPPPRYNDMRSFFSYDIRFGTDNAENIRVQTAIFHGSGKAIVKVLYGTDKPDMSATYTLIREAGQWKIDDIAPQANYVKDPKDEWANDNALDHSDSIKADMQGFYRAAEERYKQEHAKKNSAPKP